MFLLLDGIVQHSTTRNYRNRTIFGNKRFPLNRDDIFHYTGVIDSACIFLIVSCISRGAEAGGILGVNTPTF